MVDIVITGGLGLQGSKLAEELLRDGFSVRIVDNLSRGTMENLSAYSKDKMKSTLEVRHIDLRQRDLTKVALRDAETVFHLSAHLGGVEYIHVLQPQQIPMWDNMVMDGNVISASIENKVKKFIFASTACIYPVSKQLKWDSVLCEDDAFNPVEPESGYGWVKLTTEIGLNKIDCMDIGILRLFNVYGEGEDWSPGSHVIPELCRKIVKYPEEEVVVFGNGEAGRCFLYADDAVQGFKLCMEKGCINKPINLGYPEPIKIGDLVKMLMEISGKDFTPKFDLSKPTGVIGRVPDISKAEKILGWSPSVPLTEGLPRVYEWIKNKAPSP